MNFCYSICKTIVRLYRLILWQHYSVSGEHKLPPGAKIIAANHPNATDGFHFPFLFKEQLHFFMQGDIFSVPFVGFLLSRAGQIKVDLNNKAAAIEEACQKLSRGETIVILPEGKLNPDNIRIRAGTGAVRMSLTSGKPIVPVGCYVPEKHLYNLIIRKAGKPSPGRWQTGGRCFIRIGHPWLPSREIRGEVDEASLHELTAHLMEIIYSLARQAEMDMLQSELHQSE